MQSIRIAIEQASNYLVEHPKAAKASDAAATAACEDGLRFRIEGPWSPLTSDMSKSVGGDASAPSPRWLLRAALAACDATLVAMEAARDGIELTDLQVSVESESDFRGVLGVDATVQPGPLSMHVAYAWRRRTPPTTSCARSWSEPSLARPSAMPSHGRCR